MARAMDPQHAPPNNQTIPATDRVLSARRGGLRQKIGTARAHCDLLVNSKREWLVSGMVGGQSRRAPIQGLFLSHQSWYLRAPTHPGTMPKARRKESPGFTQRTEASLAGSPERFQRLFFG
jgi:hypothetical protein